jgi:membrane-associated phospholipid phosphatase
MAFRGLSFDWPSAAAPVAGCLALTALVAGYRYRASGSRSPSATLQLVAFTAVGAPLSYLAAEAARPLWDATFLAWDQSLGLDWRAYLAFVDAHPAIGTLYNLAYRSIIPQMIVAATVLGLTGRIAETRGFVGAVIFSGLVCILVSPLMPAFAMFVHLDLKPADFPNLDPAAAFVHVAPLAAIRDGAMQVISLEGVEGIITFPSYHAALGVIFAAAFWSVPLLRWPGLVLNGLMIAATPIDGGHYFVDVIAGIAVAALSLAAVRALAADAPERAGAIEAGAPVAAR